MHCGLTLVYAAGSIAMRNEKSEPRCIFFLLWRDISHTLSSKRAREYSRRQRMNNKALDGVRILDMTHVQAGPSATQLMAWLGADVIKVELPGRGDITRSQLRDVPNADSLYFTMLNSNKRSLTLNMKTPEGKALLEDLVQRCDVLVENFGPGVLDRAGFDWDRLQELNPRLIIASIKGFGPGPYADCKAYENVAQCMGGSASTTGTEDGAPTVTGAPDRRLGHRRALRGRHPRPRCCTASIRAVASAWKWRCRTRC